jgi:L-iditol 2-dehydrogenase
MELREVPEPEITDQRHVKIKMLVTGVCGSDIHYYTTGRIGSQVVSYPFAVGHEGAGVVVEVGSAVKSVKPGDEVAVEPAMSCHVCDQCRAGRPHTCRSLKFLGCPGQAEGCLSEYIVMPEECCIKLHGKLGPDNGAISEPLAIGVYSVRESMAVSSDRLAILGFGPIGMSVMLAAKAIGCTVIHVTDKIEERMHVAKKTGARTVTNASGGDVVKKITGAEPAGVDIVFECCGQQEAFDNAIDILKPGGKLVVVGIPEFDNWIMNVEKTRRKEITVRFIRRQVGCVEHALGLMNSGSVDISDMVTHRFPFSRTSDAFDLVAAYSDGVMKAMIDF